MSVSLMIKGGATTMASHEPHTPSVRHAGQMRSRGASSAESLMTLDSSVEFGRFGFGDVPIVDVSAHQLRVAF